jgi:hypothetical protein
VYIIIWRALQTTPNMYELILLVFKLPGSGHYVTDRRSVMFHTQGPNIYSASSGTRVIKFGLNGDGW